jgi:carboxylate-amine ligase
LLSHISEDAEALGCEKELGDVRQILSRGTSAHRQLRDYELERASGTSDEDSLKGVVDTLIADTAEGLDCDVLRAPV